MFMGKAQLVEIALKNLLMTKCDYSEQKIERWTLGRLEPISKLRAGVDPL
jgi:hypothetical protein